MEGVVVKSPEVFFKNGKIIGEIDITLRGNFGSTSMFIGVECRDRPADGPQGINWIQAIYGKQAHLKVDKMIAVSSTGFRDEAIELARQFKIDLLVLNQDELGQGDLKEVALGRAFIIDRIRAPLRFRNEILPVKMVMSLYKRLNDGENIALSGVAEVKHGREEYKMLAMETLQGETKSIEISFLSMDNKPYKPRISRMFVVNPDTGEEHELTPFSRSRAPL
jgi:hypothetical protein